ncbi:MAG: hypothetical protein LCH37_06055 [Bacteroidetes bacterium]|nr:hypothetical protein [Bacteroidota bacterium]
MKRILVGACVLVAAMSSCKKDETSTSTPLSAKSKTINALMANSWKPDSTVYLVGTEKLVELPEECAKDDYIEFKADGQQLLNYGANKCEPTEPATRSLTYKVNTAGDSLTIVSAPMEFAYKIQNLGSGKLILHGATDEGTETLYLSKK